MAKARNAQRRYRHIHSQQNRLGNAQQCRERIAKERGKGPTEDGIFPRGLVGHNPDLEGTITYDPEGAKALLADPSRKLYEVAHEVGYADGKYFVKLFTKEVGIPPKLYRENQNRYEMQE